MTNVKNK